MNILRDVCTQKGEEREGKVRLINHGDLRTKG